MKNIIVIILLLLSFSCFSQNNDLNIYNNPPDDNNQLSINTGNLANVQVYNQDKAPQISISQIPQQVQSDNFLIVINQNNRTWGSSSGYSASSASVRLNKNAHKHRKHFSFDGLEKLFDKKFKKVNHYKKKSRFKACSFF